KRAKRKGLQSKSQRERIDRARRNPRYEKSCNQQIVTVDQRKERGDYRESPRREKQQAARPQQASQVDAEGPDEHQRRIEGTGEPRTGVVAKAEMTFQVCQSQVKHATRKGDGPGPEEDSKGPQQRPARHFRRHRGSRSARHLRWCGLGYCSCGSHAIPAYRLVRTVAVTESPGRNFLASSVSSSAILTGIR